MVVKAKSGRKRGKPGQGELTVRLPRPTAVEAVVYGSSIERLILPITDDSSRAFGEGVTIYGEIAGMTIFGADSNPEPEGWADEDYIILGESSGLDSLEGGAGDDYLFGAAPDLLVQAAVAAVLERVPEIVHARQEKLSQETIDLLVDAYLKSAPTAPARHEIEMDNARERARFVEEFPCYSSREVADLAGHEAANVSATATRWKKARRIIGLPWKGSDLYPAFQFREGRPRPVVGRLIEALPERMSPWQVAFWLTSSNSWLGGATPIERLDDEADVVDAAAREREAIGG